MYNQKSQQNAPPPIREPFDAGSGDEDDEDKRTIFCANIDQRVTEEILFEVFLQAGPIESVRIPKDNGGRQKTFGFITYVHRCSVPFALKLLAGLSLYKKTLTIKPKHTPGGFPADCEPLQRRGGGNLALRGHNFPGYGGDENPFKRDLTPPKRVEWGSQQQRRSDELKKHSSHNSRPHQNTPYSRVDTSRDRGGGGGSSGGYQNRHNNSRRSEQRNRHR